LRFITTGDKVSTVVAIAMTVVCGLAPFGLLTILAVNWKA